MLYLREILHYLVGLAFKFQRRVAGELLEHPDKVRLVCVVILICDVGKLFIITFTQLVHRFLKADNTGI